MAKRRVKQDQASRLLRQATAYDRLAWKAHRNGDGMAIRYRDAANRLRDRAYRIRAREAGKQNG